METRYTNVNFTNLTLTAQNDYQLLTPSFTCDNPTQTSTCIAFAAKWGLIPTDLFLHGGAVVGFQSSTHPYYSISSGGMV